MDKDVQDIVVGCDLWSRVKAQALGENPFVRKDDDGKRVVMCPRCEHWLAKDELTVLSIEPQARQYCSPVMKCHRCRHMFSLIE